MGRKICTQNLRGSYGFLGLDGKEEGENNEEKYEGDKEQEEEQQQEQDFSLNPKANEDYSKKIYCGAQFNKNVSSNNGVLVASRGQRVSSCSRSCMYEYLLRNQ